MDKAPIFISWSGDASKAVAVALRKWIRQMFQTAAPFVSSVDIASGVRWSEKIVSELRSSAFAIICMTPENRHEPWIQFEAGAVSMVQTAKNDEIVPASVVPYLLGIGPAELEQPLGMYQSEEATELGTRRLAAAINERMPIVLSTGELEEAFGHWWPDLETALEEARTRPLHPSRIERRKPEDMLEELLTLTREVIRVIPRVPDDITAPRPTRTIAHELRQTFGGITRSVMMMSDGRVAVNLSRGVERSAALDDEIRAVVEANGRELAAINELGD